MNVSLQRLIEQKLEERFAPVRLIVLNESHLHVGHHGVLNGSGETHFRIRIVSEVFTGMSRVERHRAINDLLEDELKAGLHALAIESADPTESTRW